VADRGTVRFGHEVRAGYFAQDHHELLRDAEMTALDYVWGACPQEGTSTVRGQLGRMLFSGDDVDKPVGTLSGGEAARLIFGRIIVEKPNVLVLDEPTNHLDMEAIHALVDGLKAFEGTVIFVSHDRWFVSELATRILEVTPEGPRDFPGTYAEYLERCGDDHLDADAVVLKAKDVRTRPTATATESGVSWEEQKRRRNRLNALPARRDKVLAAIDTGEARRRAIAALYADPGFFQRTPGDEVKSLEHEDAELTSQIERWLAEWEEIEKELSDP
jgi:ABC-type multidrug transport system ATPase subunit